MKTYKTTLGDLFNLRQTLIKNDIINQSFSRKGGLSVARNLKKIDAELEEFTKKRDDLIREYSDTGTMDPSNPKWGEFITQYNSLSSVEASIEINTITEDELPEDITPAACISIDFMIEEPVEVVE